MSDKLVLVLLGVFLLLYGVMHVTNIQIVWMGPIAGFAALVAGAVCVFRGVR